MAGGDHTYLLHVVDLIMRGKPQDKMFDVVQLPTDFSLFSLEEHFQRLTLRVKDKFSAHDHASEVTGLCVTTESSNLAVSFTDRPDLSPNLR